MYCANSCYFHGNDFLPNASKKILSIYKGTSNEKMILGTSSRLYLRRRNNSGKDFSNEDVGKLLFGCFCCQLKFQTETFMLFWVLYYAHTQFWYYFSFPLEFSDQNVIWNHRISLLRLSRSPKKIRDMVVYIKAQYQFSDQCGPQLLVVVTN